MKLGNLVDIVWGAMIAILSIQVFITNHTDQDVARLVAFIGVIYGLESIVKGFTGDKQ